MPDLPTGTITFLFTDIEGSTKLWERCPEAMQTALARHDDLLRRAIERHNGYVFKTVGDAFCAAFPTAIDALNAVIDSQLALSAQEWEEIGTIRVRMGLHTGEAEERENDYFGQTLNRVARLQSIVHGGQTLISQVTHELLQDRLPEYVELRSMGHHRLKDLNRAEQVYQVIHPDLPSEFPPLRTLDSFPNNLPIQLSSFIGREKEMEEVNSLLDSHALVTLTGAGGTGKTRLSLQVAADKLEQYPDGVWLIELAPLSDPDHISQTIASVIGVREGIGRSLVKSLADYMKSRALLLILDNCEHLISGCAQLAQTLLQSCPKLHILASSREGLHITGERIFHVPSLGKPDASSGQTIESLTQFEAVRLFIDRAVSILSTFTVTNQNVPALAQLCSRLDGIPLAIELAAARVRSLSVEEINCRLENSFRLLSGGSRTALPRQQTLKALIDWSHDMLSEQEKRLFCRLSVFSGGWTLEAAEAVCVDEELEDWEILDPLTALIDKSLVVAEQQLEHTRFRMLEIVRQYAGDRLEENGETQKLRERHRDYFLTLAEEAAAKLMGSEQTEWIQRLDEEHQNIRAGLNFCFLETGASKSLRFCGAMQRFWMTRGYLLEGREWCVRALGKPVAQESTPERAKVLQGAGGLAYFQGDYAFARVCYEESLSLCKQIGDRSGIAGSLSNLGNVASNQGDYVSARTFYEESLNIRREIGERSGIAASLNNLGRVVSDLSDYASARTFYDESLAIMREMGHRNGIANTLNNIGTVAHCQGSYASARSCYEESLSIRRELGDRSGIALSLNNLGVMEQQEGNKASAGNYHEESLALRREIGDQNGIAMSLNNIGNMAYEKGEIAASRACHRESLTIRLDIGDQNGIAMSLEAFANLDLNARKTEKAATLWGAAEALREELGSPLPPNERDKHDREIAAARELLGKAAFSAAWQEGRAMTMEQAIERALEEPA